MRADHFCFSIAGDKCLIHYLRTSDRVDRCHNILESEVDGRYVFTVVGSDNVEDSLFASGDNDTRHLSVDG